MVVRKELSGIPSKLELLCTDEYNETFQRCTERWYQDLPYDERYDVCIDVAELAYVRCKG